MGRKIKTCKLTILLLKDSIRSYDETLRAPQSLKQVSIKNDIGFKGQFWYALPKSRTPSWLSFIKPAIIHLPNLEGKTVSAVLFVIESGRYFAITFGYGRNLLKPDCYELGFGLKVVLNRIDHLHIRSMDLRVYEELSMSTRKQVSRSADLTPFGLDTSRDLLRAVTGEPSDLNFAKRISGADALTINLRIDIGDLGKKCCDLLKAFQDIAYKEHFEWIDHLKEVRDSALIFELNNNILKTLKRKDTEKLYLAAPEPLEWQNIDCFQIGGTQQYEYNDLDIDEYLAQLGPENLEKLTIEKLKSFRVSIRESGVDAYVDKWSLFSCIVWESKSNNILYALQEGKWFQIEDSFSKTVSQFVANIPVYNGLPHAKMAEKEYEFNKRVAKENSSVFVCFDQKLIKPKDAATKIEICDLFSRYKHFIHVKRKSRSSTLSHLFSQGTVAARAFLADEFVREAIQLELPAPLKKLIPDRTIRPNASEYSVVYAVITKAGTRANALPFFSQLNLMLHMKLLDEMGFKSAFASVVEQ